MDKKDIINTLEERLMESKDFKEFKDKRTKLRQWLRNNDRFTSEEKSLIRWRIKQLSNKYKDGKLEENIDNECGIYIIHIEGHKEDIYKIGKASNIKHRLDTFNNNILCIGEVKLIAWFKTNDCSNVERIVHEKLDGFRIRKDKEFFKGDVEYFKRIIQETK